MERMRLISSIFRSKKSLSKEVQPMEEERCNENPRGFQEGCYTKNFHRPCNPHPAHWRAHSMTYEQRQDLKILSLHPSEDELSLP